MPDVGLILSTSAHRPWPLPRGPWMMFQSWQKLLFVHWRVDPASLRHLVPAPLELDLHDGDAWIGVTPFLLTGLRVRMTPPMPWASRFPELNLRTYVRYAGRAGIFFFSLDAASRTAVAGARSFFRLPYRRARMGIETSEGWTRFASRRPGGVARFRAQYRPTGSVLPPAPGSREAFLTERYALFTVLRNGKVLRTDVHHAPWPLQPAEGHVDAGALALAESVPLPSGATPLLHYSDRQDTVIWPPVHGDR